MADPVGFDFGSSELVQSPTLTLSPEASVATRQLLASHAPGLFPRQITIPRSELAHPTLSTASAPPAPFDFDGSDIVHTVAPDEAFVRGVAGAAEKAVIPFAELADTFSPGARQPAGPRVQPEQGIGYRPKSVTQLVTQSIDQQALKPNERYSGTGAEVAAGAGSLIGAAPFQAAEMGLGGPEASFLLGAEAGYEERKRALLAAGVSEEDANNAAAVSGTIEGAFQSLPLGMPGKLLKRIVTGGAAMGLAGPLSRAAENASLPDDRPDLKQPIETAGTAAADVLFGAGMHGTFGRRAEPGLQKDHPPLTPDEHAVAANAGGVPPDAVQAPALARLTALAEQDPQKAQELVNAHPADATLAAAAASHAAARPDSAAQPAWQPPGGDGQRGTGAPPHDETAGQPRQPGGSQGEVGGEVDPSPPPRAKLVRPWIDTDHDVPLAGGMGMRPDPRFGQRPIYIDRNIPEWKWDADSGRWVNLWEEIAAHEEGEEPQLDLKGYGHPGDAHEEDGNAATDANLARQGVTRSSYERLIQPHLDAARQKAESGQPIDIPADLDQRPYHDFRHLLEQQQPTPEAWATGFIWDREGNRYAEPVYGQAGMRPTVTAKSGGRFATVDLGTGMVLGDGETADVAQANASKLVKEQGLRYMQGLPEKTQASLRAEFGNQQDSRGIQKRPTVAATDPEPSGETSSFQSSNSLGTIRDLPLKPDVPITRTTAAPFRTGKEALRWALAHLRGTYSNLDTGWRIEVSRNGLEKALSRSDTRPANIQSIPALPQLLRHAVLAESRPPEEPNQNLLAIHRFYAPVEIGGVIHRAKLTVKEYNGGRRFYDQSLTELQKNEPDVATGDARSLNTTGPSGSARADRRSVTAQDSISIRDLLRGAKADDGSPLLDETNGKLTDRSPDATNNALRLRRGSQSTGVRVDGVQNIANDMAKRFPGLPPIRVIHSLADAPEPARLADAAQRRSGALGDVKGFLHDGTIYLNAGALEGFTDVFNTLAHEAVGHYGLRGVFGERLNGVLDRVHQARTNEVRQLAFRYGLKWGDLADRRTAAEEFIAHLAEQRPEMSLVKQAIAAIRRMLRPVAEALGIHMQLTDEDIVHNFILPARRVVEHPNRTGSAEHPTRLSRSDKIENQFDVQPDTHTYDEADYISSPQNPLGTNTTYLDPVRLTYNGNISPDTPVKDHIEARALGGSDTDPRNFATRAWAENARKGAYEGQYLADRKRLVDDGLTPEQADWVLEGELRWIQNDVHATPVDPAILETLPSP